MRNRAEANHFIGYIHIESIKAVYFQDHFREEPEWLPKSQIIIHRSEDTDEVYVEISQWLCGQSGWEEHTGVDETRDEVQSGQ